MKINVGIVGYGNLGKAVERSVISNKHLSLVAIFSRRNVISSFNTPVEPYENFICYKGKIDVMLLCGGSKSDLEIQTPEVLKYFDCINTFDTHTKIPGELKKLGELAKESGHRLIMSCGWDPGLFSVVRAMMLAIGGNEPVTFWGRGVSMGHSDAIRRIDGVIDAVQFTVPNKEAVKLARSGILSKDIPLHTRECYVLADIQNRQRIEREIRDIPNYFRGQPTSVTFVPATKLLKLKGKLYHKGEVIEHFTLPENREFKMSFSVSMDSNPDFTAKIVTAYIFAVYNLKARSVTGAFTNLDIPVSFLFPDESRENLIGLC